MARFTWNAERHCLEKIGTSPVRTEHGNGCVVSVAITDDRFEAFKQRMAERDLSNHPIFGKGVA